MSNLNSAAEVLDALTDLDSDELREVITEAQRLMADRDRSDLSPRGDGWDASSISD